MKAEQLRDDLALFDETHDRSVLFDHDLRVKAVAESYLAVLEPSDELVRQVAMALSLHTNGHVEDYARDDAERGEWDEMARVALAEIGKVLSE